ncbi:COX15/CtaA family protein [Fischerella thermalis]|jgi:cytochrome c oxidase assembly protein subunit 15|uniref:Cytochrome oxidase assembly n=1 Tax=Fischerella thermalis JSC-11 TaxID=741277 RepID=G6FPS0_9CYAN|nr:heme A synthase [Fischerella thermalis]PMB08949.1 heme A synthase [Fischerella thermalis CCMEE 5273]EHC18870.1 cytochrome oxidase assembly [Fischerella thermalis JSC-11]PLZ06658.1 heme A synthase [Fischerella thermalis WC119]PLZ18644.1 heme A synthase [Fischerella thermalis WC1110]PLZ39023.1 heme A synthase [Fischerella thermalis WC527]
MSEFVLEQQNLAAVEQQNPKDRIRRWVWRMCVATLMLMAIGSATRVMNAGLACPDWPLCYGELVPTKQMNFQVFLEWFHRLDAALIGVSAIALVGVSWWNRRCLPKWLPWASTFALFLIIFQGVLGGLTVTQLLRFDIVTAHLGTALVFFSTLLAIGTALTPYQATGTVGKLPWVGLTATILVYVQSLLGALVGSRWALHQCFAGYQLCDVMYSHIFGLIPPTLAILTVVFMTWRTPALHPALRKLANMAGGLLILQLIVGFATFRLHLQVEPLTVSHQAIGATLLGILVVFTVLCLRDWVANLSINAESNTETANPIPN